MRQPSPLHLQRQQAEDLLRRIGQVRACIPLVQRFIEGADGTENRKEGIDARLVAEARILAHASRKRDDRPPVFPRQTRNARRRLAVDRLRIQAATALLFLFYALQQFSPFCRQTILLKVACRLVGNSPFNYLSLQKRIEET